ncbi:hypothetical protein C8F04DRAFT_1277724 [Mycena alexandri]|uniref:DUF6534 domain-containing protein n=1 Tax=Mycena alexandri TaxID=1745969 RepID=A0AAD6S0U9_9AGAR|nr:hypothetical protein C8F04DRAFT_1277724 [Mycena alexandri]
MDPRPSSVPEVGQLTIPTFVGTLLNWGLLGALAVQVYLYFYAFPRDRLIFKLAVGFIMVAEILQTLGKETREMLLSSSGKGGGLRRISISLVGRGSVVQVMVGSTIGVVSQTFFAWRISILGRTRFIPAVIMAITAVQFSSAIWTSVLMLRVKTFSQLQIHLLKPPAVWLAATAAADLVCAATTAFYVIRNRRGNFSPTTLAALSRVLKVTVETGALCAVFASVNLYLFIKYDGNNYHLGVCNWIPITSSRKIMNSRAHIGHIPPEGTCPGTEVVFTSYNAPSTPLQVCVETVTTRRDSKGIISPVRPVFTSKHEHRMGVYRYGEEIPESDGRA